MTHESAMRLLHATREQLHGKPTRDIVPFDVAQKAGINPYRGEYSETVSYLLNNGYIEQHANAAYARLGLYRITNKGLEEVMSGTHE
jgi:predicted transcriptional regulator